MADRLLHCTKYSMHVTGTVPGTTSLAYLVPGTVVCHIQPRTPHPEAHAIITWPVSCFCAQVFATVYVKERT